jgi:hypothetical protein
MPTDTTNPKYIPGSIGPGNLPTTPAIDVSQIGTASTFNLPAAPTPASYDISSVPDISSLLNPSPTVTETKQGDLENKLLDNTRTLATTAQITAEANAGLSVSAH